MYTSYTYFTYFLITPIISTRHFLSPTANLMSKGKNLIILGINNFTQGFSTQPEGQVSLILSCQSYQPNVPLHYT